MAPMDLCAFACSLRSGTARLSGFDERGNAFRVGCGSIELMEQVMVRVHAF